MRLVDVWIIEQRLGQGGVGTVYRCRNRDAPRIRAAVKLLSPSLAASAEVRRRFVREAELLFRLDHPNIVKVRNVRMDHDPPFIEMVYVDGQTLTAVRARARLTIPQICALAAPLLRAVQYLHGSGVQHRDIKPDNVIVRGLKPTLVDFGLAAEDHNATLARPGAPMGTVSYVPPEWGGARSPRGEAWDLYSLGVILWECIKGETAFPLDTERAVLEQLVDIRARKLEQPCLDPGEDVPAALRDVVCRLTSRDPMDRILDLEAHAEALDALRAELAAAGEVAEPIADVWVEGDVEVGTHTTFDDSLDAAPGAPFAGPQADTAALPEAPSPAPPKPPPAAAPRRRRWGWAAGLAVVGAAAALSGVAVLGPTAPEAPTAPEEAPAPTTMPRLLLTLDPQDPGLPVRLWLGNVEIADPTEPPVLAPGNVELTARVGVDCGEGALPPHCAEKIRTISIGEAEVEDLAVRLELPAAAPQPVVLRAPKAAPERVQVDGGAWQPWPDAAKLTLLPGPHAVVAQAGACPEAPCGAGCDADCREVQVSVLVPFEATEPVVARLALPQPPPPPPAPVASRPATGPVTVDEFRAWIVGKPSYQPGGAQAVARADDKYLRWWDGTTPRNSQGEPAAPGGAVDRVSFDIARDYCAGRGGLADERIPAGANPEMRLASDGRAIVFDSATGPAPISDRRATRPAVGFRCKRR